MNNINKIWARLDVPLWQLCLAVFLISFAIRIALIFVFHTYRDLGRYELERTALSLAFKGVYGNPYAIPTGPTAHVSPGYTLILAAIFRIFGTGVPAEIVKEVLATFVTSLQYALIPVVAAAFFLGRWTGLIAGLVCAIYPAKFLVQTDGDWETPYTALFLILVCVYAINLWTDEPLTLREGMKSGLLWGIALLFASVLLPIFMAFVATGCWFRRNRLPAALRFSAVQICIVFLCLSPWMIRNYFALGSPIATRSNLGLELHVSNNDEASADQLENYKHGVYDRYHPLQNRAEAEKVRRLGEVRYNREAQQETDIWIENHPARFAALTLGRVEKFWFYTDKTSVPKTIFLDVTGFLGLLGAAYLLWTNLQAGTAVVLILLLYPAPSYLIHVGLRQRYPIDWLLVLLSTFLFFEGLRRFTGEKVTAVRRP